MSLAEQARNVAAAGRYGDTTILHLNPAELRGIASVLPLTINPETGYAEAFLPMLLGAAAPSLLGGTALGATLGATGLGMGGALAGGLAQGALTGDMESGITQGLMGAATGGLGGLAGAAASGLGAGGAGAAGSAAAGSAAGGAGAAAPLAAAAPPPIIPAAIGATPPGLPMGVPPVSGVPPVINAAPPGLGGAVPPGIGGPPVAAPMGSPVPVPRPVGGPPPGLRAGVPQAAPTVPPAGGPGPSPVAGNPASPGFGAKAWDFVKANPKLAIGAGMGAASLASSLFDKGPDEPKKRKRGSRDRQRSERDYTHADPDAMGRENRYFSRRRLVPYHEGGIASVMNSPSIPRFSGRLNRFGSRFGRVPNYVEAPAPMAINPDLGNQNLGWEQISYTSPTLPSQGTTTTPTTSPVTGSTGGTMTTAQQRMDSSKAEGGIVSMMDRPGGYAEGGIAAMAQGSDEAIIHGARMAIHRQHPNPESAIRSFIKRFGAQAFESMMARELAGNGDVSDGKSDSVPAVNPGGAPAALSEGEYVVPADVVSHLGNGSTGAGAEAMSSMVDNVRQARTGTPKSPDQIDPMRMMPA